MDKTHDSGSFFLNISSKRREFIASKAYLNALAILNDVMFFMRVSLQSTLVSDIKKRQRQLLE